METVRGLVRPIVTFLVFVVLALIVIGLVSQFADADMAKTVVQAFLVLVGTIGGFWFASRNNNTPTT